MAKTKISEYSSTANSNTDVASINIDENCAPSGINNAIRAIMGHLKDWQAGLSGDTLPVASGGTGSTTASAARTALGLTIGTNVQAYSSELQAISNGGGNVMFKNRIINGAMMIDQRNAGASVATSSGASVFATDRWKLSYSQTSKFTAQQSSTAPAGYTNSLLITSSSAYSVGAGDYFSVLQAIEGYNVADFGLGAAGAATFTFSFWVRSSLTGTFGGSLTNSAFNRSYPFTYTISSANTWEQKTVTVTGDTTGTWLTTNAAGLNVLFGLGVGTTYSGTAGSWAGANYNSATGATSVVGTSGATFYITGVQLEKGSTATSFDYRPYGTELALCQRYCNVIKPALANSGLFSGVMFTTTGSLVTYNYPVVMRSAPTVTFSAAGDFLVVTGGNVDAASAVTASAPSTVNARFDFTSSIARTNGQGSIIQTNNTSSAVTLNAEL